MIGVLFCYHRVLRTKGLVLLLSFETNFNIDSNYMMERIKQNPILKPGDISPSQEGFIIECLLNPGAFIFDNKTWLLLRVAERPRQIEGVTSFPIMEKDGSIKIMELDSSHPDLDLSDPRVINYKGQDYLTTMSHLKLVSSTDGINFKEDENYPAIFASGEYESYGIEDCRVTQFEESYYLTYTAVSKHGVGVGLITTTDWKKFDRHGLILSPHNKDCAIFEEKINGKYYMLHRPSSPEIGGNYIWVAESEDKLHWGKHKCIAHSRKGMWDEARVGAGCSPIKTKDGWLAIYHGADKKHRYCLGALLLDLENPSKVLARSQEPIMVPEAEYELTGFFGNVVFTNGHIVNDDKITIYYGASDEVICAAESSINKILKSLNF